MITVHPFASAYAQYTTTTDQTSNPRLSLAPIHIHGPTSRPTLLKRHTSPSPAALLRLTTLEALPPTPPPRSTSTSTSTLASTAGIGFRRSTSSFQLTPALFHTEGNKMPLLRPQSRRPNSPRAQTSFLPFDIPPAIINTFSFQPSSSKTHSQSTPPTQTHTETNQSYSPFSASTPPATFSRAAQSNLHALPSIEGVMDKLYDIPPPSPRQPRFPSRLMEKRVSGRTKRETMRLPLMSPPRPLRTTINDDEPLDMDEWEWGAFNTIGPSKQQLTQRTKPPSPILPQYRKRNTSLSVATDFHPSRPSSSSRSVPSCHPSSHQSYQSSWSNGEANEELDEEGMKAMQVLEHLNGQLLRDGWGYGTGRKAKGNSPQRGSDIMESEPLQAETQCPSPLLTRAEATCFGHDPDRSAQSVVSDRFDQPPSDLRPRTISGYDSKESTSIRSWREARKRSKTSPTSHSPGIDIQQLGEQTYRTQTPASRRAPPPAPLSLTQAHRSDTRGNLADTSSHAHIHTKPLESSAHIEYNRSQHNDERGKHWNVRPPPIPPRSAQRLSVPLPVHNEKRVPRQLESKRSSPSLQSRKKVPLIIPSSQHLDRKEAVVISNDFDTFNRETALPPIQQRPLPPLPTDQIPLQRINSINQTRLATRILRPKRPSTAPIAPALTFGANNDLSSGSLRSMEGTIDSTTLKQKSPPSKLVPRDEKQLLRRLSDRPTPPPTLPPARNSLSTQTASQQKGLSALSFLALDELAMGTGMIPPSLYIQPELPIIGKMGPEGSSKATHRRRATSFGSISISTTSHQNYYSGIGRSVSPSPAHIIPPSERSKIGVDDRREHRSRRKDSHSSLSSVAGSDFSDDLGKPSVTAKYYEEWSSAQTFNTVQSQERCTEGRRGFSVDVNLQLTRSTGNGRNDHHCHQPLSPPPRPKRGVALSPLPLSLSMIGRAQDEDDHAPLKTPSLLPPPRARRSTNNTITTAVLGTPHASVLAAAHADGFQKEFMDPSSPSQSPATPNPLVFSSGGRRRDDIKPGEERKASGSSGDAESYWSAGQSSDSLALAHERETERRRMMREWLASKPTRRIQAPAKMDVEVELKDHPFFNHYYVGKSAKVGQ